jgi:sulfonate transport system permease protein
LTGPSRVRPSDSQELSTKKRKMGESLRSWMRALALPLLLLVTWDLSVRFNIVPSSLVASPSMTLQDLISMISDGKLAAHCAISLKRLLFGFGIGTSIGIMLGMAIGISRLFAELIEPTIALLAPIPAIAWVPMLIMMLGIGDTAKIALIAFGTVFVVTLHTSHGIRSTGREFVELSEVLGKSKRELLIDVLFPAALPEIFTGMRIAMALSWTLLLVSEIIASSEGLGWLIWDARNFSRPDDLFVGMIAVGVLGRLTDYVLVMLERSSTRWQSTFETWQSSVQRS